MGILIFSLWLAGLAGVIILVVTIITHDYTKDEKGKDIKEKIDDYLIK